MKNKVLYFIAIIFSFVASSCSEDVLDDINKNVNSPTDVETKLIITDVMTSTAFSVTGSDLAFYASCYIEHNVGVYNQFYNAEIRSGEPQNATTYNNSWGALYENLYNLKIIIDKCTEGGAEAGNYHTLGIAQVLSAYNLSVLTDLMGDVPWSEALQPGVIFTPKLDSQESIYTEIFSFLDDAISNLEKESSFPALGAQDFLYGGSVENWKKFAYGLKARYKMRLSARTPDYDAVIAAADLSFTSPAEQCQFEYDGTNTKSPFSLIFTDRDYYGASQSLHDKLTARNDPRDAIFFKPYPGTEADGLIFAPNGAPNQEQGLYSISAISDATAPTYLLSYHEIEFLKAEAYVRKNDLTNAEASLKKAIKAAFAKVNIDLSETEADDYFTNSIQSKFNANPLAEVMVQKYLAFFEEEALEAYNDYRRLNAMGDDVISLDNPANTTQFPLRFTYGADDVTTNSNIKDAYGDGTYVYTENVWWAGGTR